MKRILLLVLFSVFVFFLFPHFGFSEESNYEIVFWETIKDSKDPKLYQIYLEKYPNGTFSEIAEVFLRKYSSEPLTQAPVTKPQPVQQEPQKVVKKSTYDFAIFPFKFLDDGESMRGIVINDITRVATRYQCLRFSHSYYDMDARYAIKDLSKNSVIAQSSINPRQLWRNSAPNTDTISSVGRELGIDTVILGTLNIDNPWSDAFTLGYIRIYMVDVATGQVVKAKNHSNLSDARDVLPSIIQEAIGGYTDQFCK